MPFSDLEKSILLERVSAIEDTLAKIFNMFENTSSAKEMRQLTNVRQREISDILTRISSLESEVRSLTAQMANLS